MGPQLRDFVGQLSVACPVLYITTHPESSPFKDSVCAVKDDCLLVVFVGGGDQGPEERRVARMAADIFLVGRSAQSRMAELHAAPADPGPHNQLPTLVSQSAARPAFRQIERIDTADSCRVIVAGGRKVRRLIGTRRSRQHAVRPAAVEAVERSDGDAALNQRQAIDVVVSKGHIVEHTLRAGLVAESRIARAARISRELRQRVVHIVRISLVRLGGFIDQSLDARHDRRSERGSAGTGPGGRSAGARGSAETGSRVRIAENVVMAPKAVAGEQRDIGNVAHAIVGIAEDAALERGFGIASASSADHALYFRGPGCTGARAAAARRHDQKPRARRAVAEAIGAEGLWEAQELRDQRARTGIVPRNLGNV